VERVDEEEHSVLCTFPTDTPLSAVEHPVRNNRAIKGKNKDFLFI